MAEAAGLFDEYSGLRTPSTPDASSTACIPRTSYGNNSQSAPSTMLTNPQRVETLEQLEASSQLKRSGVDFHNSQSPNLQIIHEKPEHRIMVYLKAKGHTNVEIAKATGYTQPWVSQIVRQPWFKQRLADELREAGVDGIKSFLSSEALPSLQVLADIRDGTANPAPARVAAANAILDRAFGKPTVHVESQSTVNVTNAKQSADALEQELKSINEQLVARGQRPAN